MSVVKGKRKENDLQVIRSLRELAIHTIGCCCNESVFPKSKRWLYTQRITNEAVDALLPADPSEDGSYYLKATRASGTTTLSWEAQE